MEDHMSQDALSNLAHEDRLFPPSTEFSAEANADAMLIAHLIRHFSGDWHWVAIFTTCNIVGIELVPYVVPVIEAKRVRWIDE
jgi:hypothetical protein